MTTSDCHGRCRVGQLPPEIVKHVDALLSERVAYALILSMLDNKVPGHGLRYMNLYRHKPHIIGLPAHPEPNPTTQEVMSTIRKLAPKIRKLNAPNEINEQVTRLKEEIERLEALEKPTIYEQKKWLSCIAELRLWIGLSKEVLQLDAFSETTLEPDWVEKILAKHKKERENGKSESD